MRRRKDEAGSFRIEISLRGFRPQNLCSFEKKFSRRFVSPDGTPGSRQNRYTDEPQRSKEDSPDLVIWAAVR